MAAIAARLESDYLLAMVHPARRRWFAFFAAVALILGLAAYGVAAADMGAKMMPTADGAMAPAGMCNGCGGGDDGMPATACNALCGGTVALLPEFVPIAVAAVEPAIPVAMPPHLGRAGPPDPYPPRLSILS